MKSLDNTINYYELLMKYDNTSKNTQYDLPSNFRYEFYQQGDEVDWVNIHIESGEFTSYKQGLEYFHEYFNSFQDELPKRCFFIVNNENNEKIGTATVSLLKKPEFGYKAAVDWLAIKKQYQGKRLAKPLISKVIEVANSLKHKKIILHTQTTTWLAAILYLDYGFEILNKEETTGWSILKTLTNHPKLSMYKELPKEEIYDKRNVEIEKQLIKKYGTSNFNYSVWYKNNLHNVYTYVEGKSYEYEYFYKKNKIILKEIHKTQSVNYFHIIPLILLLIFLITIIIDYIKYDPITTSAPFYACVIIRTIEFIFPGAILYGIGFFINK